mmetsp:Transcript_15119/g.33235  ORF Transcript_15119/g.33235 Transcript_15119/m.33235 type:complete len:269 (+) Transcript_15119:218-1024(+)
MAGRASSGVLLQNQRWAQLVHAAEGGACCGYPAALEELPQEDLQRKAVRPARAPASSGELGIFNGHVEVFLVPLAHGFFGVMQGSQERDLESLLHTAEAILDRSALILDGNEGALHHLAAELPDKSWPSIAVPFEIWTCCELPACTSHGGQDSLDRRTAREIRLLPSAGSNTSGNARVAQHVLPITIRPVLRQDYRLIAFHLLEGTAETLGDAAGVRMRAREAESTRRVPVFYSCHHNGRRLCRLTHKPFKDEAGPIPLAATKVGCTD